jgi:hypothetical protein
VKAIGKVPIPCKLETIYGWLGATGQYTNDGRANLPVCPNLTASKRSNAGGTMGIRTPEHRSAHSSGSLGGAAAPPYLGGGVEVRHGWLVRELPAFIFL